MGRLLRTLSFTALCLCGLVTSCGIARAYTWDDRFAGVGFNDDVAAIMRYGDDLLVGGRFAQVGPILASRVARWDGTAWHPMGSPPWNRTETFADYQGEIYASGQFGSAICKWDGTQWVSIGSIAFGSYESHAFAMVPFQGELVIGGGFFFEVDGHQGIFAWTGSELVDIGNRPDTSNGRIADLVIYDGDLYATGRFESSLDSVPMTCLARYDGTSWTPVGGRSIPGGPLVEGLRLGPNRGDGFALAVHDGKLVIAGEFDFAGDLAVSNMCTWDATTQMWGDIGGGSPDPVHGMTTVGGDLFVGGRDLNFSGTPAPGIAKWDGVSWSQVSSWDADGILVLEDVGGALGVGGSFAKVDGLQVERFTVWDGSQYSAMLVPGGQGVDAPIKDFCLYDGALVAVGEFEYGGETQLGRIGAWNGQSWSGFDGGADAEIRRVIADGSDLVVVGDFTVIGGQPADRVARWDGTSWQPFGVGVPGTVEALCVHDGDLHVGGDVEGEAYVARWDGAAWQEIPLHPSIRRLSALASHGGKLIAAGSYFIFSSPTFFAVIGQWDGVTWSPMLTAAGTTMESGDGGIIRLRPYQGDLYLGGRITSLGGTWPSAVITDLHTARWDGTTLHPIPESSVNQPAYGVELFSAHDFAAYDGRLFIAGTPESVGGSLWSSDLVDQWEPVGDTNGRIEAALEFDGMLYLGGRYTNVSNAFDDPEVRPSSYFGALGPDATGISGPASLRRLRLGQNEPNPFNPSTTIRFELPERAEWVSLTIHDLRGRKVRSILSRAEATGSGTAIWDGRDDSGMSVASGAYFYTLETDAGALSRKMLLLK